MSMNMQSAGMSAMPYQMMNSLPTSNYMSQANMTMPYQANMMPQTSMPYNAMPQMQMGGNYQMY